MIATWRETDNATHGLRTYQRDAVEDVERARRELDGGLVFSVPTGGGKSHILGALAQAEIDRGGRVIVLAHRRELLVQNLEKLVAAAPHINAGICSSGLGRWDVDADAVFAGIATAYRRTEQLGRFTLALVDECHHVGPDDQSMYRKGLARAAEIEPSIRLVGCSATPWRTESGGLCSPTGLFRHVVHEVEMLPLIKAGFLAWPVCKYTESEIDTSKLRKRRGDFDEREAESAMGAADVVSATCAEIVRRTADRQSTLVFGVTVRHGERVTACLRSLGVDARFVEGNTPSDERTAILGGFRDREFPYLVNVGIATEGYDAPGIDAIALLRPTASSCLFSQMVGRGLRVDPSKSDCLILDFGGNFRRFGPIDLLRAPQHRDPSRKGPPPTKVCRNCEAIIAIGATTCPHCGHKFLRSEEPKHTAYASDAAALSFDRVVERHEVFRVNYALHRKRGAPLDRPPSLRVGYLIDDRSNRWVSEWLGVESKSFVARSIFGRWWKDHARTAPPTTVLKAIGRRAELRTPETIDVVHQDGFPTVIGRTFVEAEPAGVAQ